MPVSAEGHVEQLKRDQTSHYLSNISSNYIMIRLRNLLPPAIFCNLLLTPPPIDTPCDYVMCGWPQISLYHRFRIGGKIRFDLFYACTLDRVPATDSVVSLEMLKQQASETKFLWAYLLKIVFTRWVSIHFFFHSIYHQNFKMSC